jgi:PAS domain S-box-containing protein
LTQDARLEYTNSYAAHRFGFDLDKIRGCSVEEIFPPKMAAGQRQSVLTVCSTGEPLEVERLTAFPSGPAWLSTHLVPLKNAAGNVTAVLGVSRDVTKRKRAEEQLREMEAHLRQAQKVEAIDTLAGGISHDFNNILGPCSDTRRSP